MQGIEQIVNTYLDDNLADYAIMIDGAWGSGKTYCWNRVIAPLVALRNAAKPGKKQRTAYVSLYGLTTPEDIDREIFLALHPVFGGKAAKVAKTAGPIFASGVELVTKNLLGFSLGAAKIEIADWLRLDDVVLCFDDLERSSIPISDMMGYINQYVEHKKVKTFILCYEGVLESRDKDAYTKIKEKLIGRTIQFHVEHAEVVDSLIKMLSGDAAYQQFLRERRAEIIQIFQKSDLDNVRILMHGLSALHAVFSSLHSRFPNRPDLIARFDCLVLSLTFEFRSGRATEEHVRDLSLQERTMFYTALHGKEGEESYVDQYFKRYFGGNSTRAATSTAIGNFIISGQLDERRLLEELKWLTEVKNDFDAAIETLFSHDFFGRQLEVDDEQFENATRKILDTAKDGLIDSYPLLYKLFGYAMGWAMHGLVKETADDIKVMMKDAVEKAVANGRLKFHDDLEEALHFFDVEGNADLRTFHDYLLDVNHSLEKDRNKAQALMLLDDLKNRPDIALAKIYREWRDVPVFGTVSPDELTEAIKVLPNGMKDSFKYAIENRYRHGISDVHRQEYDGLAAVMTKLSAWVEKNSRRPRGRSVFFLEQIVKQLQSSIKQIEGARQP